MNACTESFLWASVIWGALGGGYMLYGWRQRAMLPFLGGLVMTTVSCFLPALPMSLICLAVIAAVWWLTRQGY